MKSLCDESRRPPEPRCRNSDQTSPRFVCESVSRPTSAWLVLIFRVLPAAATISVSNLLLGEKCKHEDSNTQKTRDLKLDGRYTLHMIVFFVGVGRFTSPETLDHGTIGANQQIRIDLITTSAPAASLAKG